MAREFGRSARVSSQIQKELSLVLQRDVKDPRLGFVTVNEVEVSRDLAVAKVYITVLNSDEKAKKQNLAILNEAAHFLRGEVGRRMKLRMTPELRFFYDDSFDRGMRVAELLNEVKPKSDEDTAD